jgi:hypothetical protein
MGLIHVEETQQTYTDSLGVVIPSQKVSLSRFTFGPEIGYQVVLRTGATMEPHASLTGIWDFDIPCAPMLIDITMNGRTVNYLPYCDARAGSGNLHKAIDGVSA